MDLDFSEEQTMLREMVRGVCASGASLDVVRELEDDPKGFGDEFWKQLAELDLIGLTIGEEYGGSGMSLLEAAIVYEEFGRALAPSPHFASAVMSAGVLAAAGRTSSAGRGCRASPRATPSSYRRGSSRTTGSGRRACSCEPPPTATGTCSMA